ncbi:glycosyltransferase [Prosthecobacter dejongeii]|uniref:Glycosyltransferase involved in cell wall biosynthesis n=1 Tax=Prosthecobacter dejongeii TaxID=48465 RepID=A0A7W7YLP3_9BACT|nr:glycosyltransferase [Prosthecobacter dejongeii]MBB5038521.1 glycosyltransferase involved in cell wall biosynthesis [Prosthecobacter dejongeii]
MKLTPLFLLGTRLSDTLRYSETVRSGVGRLLSFAALWTKKPTRVALLTRALSLCDRPATWQPILKRLQQETHGADDRLWREAMQDSSRLPGLVKKDPALTRTVLLKRPGENGEKGVLLHYFEYNLARLLMALPAADLQWLAARYDIVLAASWTPTDYALLGLATALLPDGIWVQPATHGERERLTRFHPQLRCLPGLACDWVEPAFYQPKPWSERSIDILMVANWGDFKRHWEFFDALTRLPKELRVVLIGQNEGRNTRETIAQLAQKIGVPQNLEIKESLPIAEVTRLQCDSKISMVISRREGGCVAMVESLFAGAAIAMREGASIGSAAHINEKTGAFLRPSHLAEDIQALLQRGSGLDSATWAADHISCHISLAAMEATLREHAKAQNRPWTYGLAKVHWRPHPVLANAEERQQMQSAYDELHQRFPHLFTQDLMTRSAS